VLGEDGIDKADQGYGSGDDEWLGNVGASVGARQILAAVARVDSDIAARLYIAMRSIDA
jgi:hypothetical protein